MINSYYNQFEKHKSEKIKLERIWVQVPPDYYQKGVATNFFQKLWHHNKLLIVCSLIAKSKPRKILDVGCASGWFLSQIKQSFPEIECYGVDPYTQAINYGLKLYPAMHLTIADGHKLPFPNDFFDLVICAEVLEHVVNPNLVITEIKRVMEKNGKAVIEMDSGSFLFKLIWRFWNLFVGRVWKKAHLHLFDCNKLENLIIRSGFQIVTKKTFNFGMAVVFEVKK